MARLNLTIPDPLYERLELVRERINISKICAQALERELTMLEHTKVDVAVVARVLSRLQVARDRWFKHGWDDASEWAAETATRDELVAVATKMADWSGEQIMNAVHPPQNSYLATVASLNALIGANFFPDSFPLDERLEYWENHDREAQLPGTGDAQEDEIAYLEGWRDAVKEIWEAVAPSL